MIRISDTLLKSRIFVFEKDHHGYTPIEYAATSGKGPLLCYLVEYVRHLPDIAKVTCQRSLSSAWSLAVRSEQWIVIGGMLAMDPNFEPDMSLLDSSPGAKNKLLNILPSKVTHWEDVSMALWSSARKKARWKELLSKHYQLCVDELANGIPQNDDTNEDTDSKCTSTAELGKKGLKEPVDRKRAAVDVKHKM